LTPEWQFPTELGPLKKAHKEVAAQRITRLCTRKSETMVFVKPVTNAKVTFRLLFLLTFALLFNYGTWKMASNGSASNKYLGKESLFFKVVRVLDVFLSANDKEWRSTERKRPEKFFFIQMY